MTLSKRMTLAGAVTIVAALVTFVALNRKQRGIVITQNGQTVTVKERNAGVTNAFGEFTALISIKYGDGSPAAGLRYRMELPLQSSNVVASAGSLTTNGTAVVAGLAGGFPPVFYSLYLEDNLVGQVVVGSESRTNRFDGVLPAKAGMRAPDLVLRDLALNMTFRLSDLRCQIVFLEFFTTRCAPCQPVLGKLNALLGRRGGEWESKVTVLAVGLDTVLQPDSSAESVAAHLRRKGWRSLHPIVPDQVFSWEPSKRFPFGVSGVPHSFLIGRDGVILWSGFPNDQEVEQRIEDQLKMGL